MNKVARDKDRILAQIKAYTPHQKIVGLDKYLPELEHGGLVEVWRDEQGELIRITLLPICREFISNGGYRKFEADKRKEAIRNFASSFLGRVVEAVLIAILILIATWWLKRNYGLSDSPQCGEHIELKNDSTSSSRLSSRCLNDDNVASLGKSEEICRDSSRSTLDKHSVGIRSNETSAQQPSVIDESNAVPSGK